MHLLASLQGIFASSRPSPCRQRASDPTLCVLLLPAQIGSHSWTFVRGKKNRTRTYFLFGRCFYRRCLFYFGLMFIDPAAGGAQMVVFPSTPNGSCKIAEHDTVKEPVHCLTVMGNISTNCSVLFSVASCIRDGS